MTDKLGPYEINQIYCGECGQMMAALPDNCIDFWLTSPPYGEMRAYNGYTFDFERIAAQLYRVTKPGGVGVWVVADETKNGSESGTSFKQALGFMAIGFNLHDTMIYEALGTGAKGSNLAYWQAFEFMFVFSKGQPKSINRLKDKKNKAIGSVHVAGKKAAGLNTRTDMTERRVVPEYSIRSNIWQYNVNKHAGDSGDHPAPFPEALARDHILSWSNPGDVVLDPMMGSGTVGKMCALTGRNYLGFDISPEYVELARHRLANVEAQPFLMPPSVEANGKPEQAAMFAGMK